MIYPEDVQKLAAAHDRIRHELARDKPRSAARIACQELRRLVDNGSFWDDVPQAAQIASEYRNKIDDCLSKLKTLIDDEGAIFGFLGVDASVSAPILSDVYGMTALTIDARPELTGKALELLRGDVSKAADLICDHSKGRIRHAVDWVISVKGARVIAGAAVAASNGAIALSPGLVPPFAPLVAGHAWAIASTSITAGIGLMSGETKQVIEAFKPE